MRSDCPSFDPEADWERFDSIKEEVVSLLAGVDCTHVTERKGSPYTLVCRKTTASWKRLKETHEGELDLLAKLERRLGKV